MNFESTVENGTCLFPVVNQQCPLVLEKQQVLTKRAKQQPFKAEWMVMRLKHSWIVECIFYLPMVLLCHSQISLHLTSAFSTIRLYVASSITLFTARATTSTSVTS